MDKLKDPSTGESRNNLQAKLTSFGKFINKHRTGILCTLISIGGLGYNAKTRILDFPEFEKPADITKSCDDLPIWTNLLTIQYDSSNKIVANKKIPRYEESYDNLDEFSTHLLNATESHTKHKENLNSQYDNKCYINQPTNATPVMCQESHSQASETWIFSNYFGNGKINDNSEFPLQYTYYLLAINTTDHDTITVANTFFSDPANKQSLLWHSQTYIKGLNAFTSQCGEMLSQAVVNFHNGGLTDEDIKDFVTPWLASIEKRISSGNTDYESKNSILNPDHQQKIIYLKALGIQSNTFIQEYFDTLFELTEKDIRLFAKIYPTKANVNDNKGLVLEFLESTYFRENLATLDQINSQLSPKIDLFELIYQVFQKNPYTYAINGNLYMIKELLKNNDVKISLEKNAKMSATPFDYFQFFDHLDSATTLNQKIAFLKKAINTVSSMVHVNSSIYRYYLYILFQLYQSLGDKFVTDNKLLETNLIKDIFKLYYDRCQESTVALALSQKQHHNKKTWKFFMNPPKEEETEARSPEGVYPLRYSDSQE